MKDNYQTLRAFHSSFDNDFQKLSNMYGIDVDALRDFFINDKELSDMDRKKMHFRQRFGVVWYYEKEKFKCS